MLARQTAYARHCARRARRHRRRASPRRASLAAASAAAFALPTFKSRREDGRRQLASLRLLAAPSDRVDLADARAQALGNNVARWFTALPPNVLDDCGYRQAIEQLAKARGIACRFFGERELKKLGAGAFLAVARGNATRDAGILHLRYRPSRGAAAQPRARRQRRDLRYRRHELESRSSACSTCTPTCKAAPSRSARCSRSRSCAFRSAIDAWLAITENRLAADAYNRKTS